MRKQPKTPPPDVKPQPQDDIVTQEREYKLITPLFGGGAVAGERDAVTIVRGTEVRGMLRFWWRACYGGRYEKVEDMKEAEDQLWGKAHKKDETPLKPEETIQIIVGPINTESILEKRPYTIEKDKKGRYQAKPTNGIPGYAAFPFQPSRKELDAPILPQVKPVFVNVSFRLTISFPFERKREIEGVLWAWETFGGVGARTRRGFGALRLDKINDIGYNDLPLSQTYAVKKWIADKFTHFSIANRAPDEHTPFLSQAMLATEVYSTREFREFKEADRGAWDAWNNLIQRLSKFRQARDNDRRSQWPDTREIKKIAQQRQDDDNAQSQIYKFPKGVFGLPIVFHLADSGKDEDLTLQGSEDGKDRLASPLILRPLACKGNTYVGLALLLQNRELPSGSLQIVKREKKQEKPMRLPGSIDTELSSDEIDEVEILNGEKDVLKAFMNYLRRGK